MESVLSATDRPTKVGRRQFAGLRLHPFLFDVLTTGLTQAATLAANFVLVGAVSRKMGVMVLGEYLLVKRVSAWLLSGSQLGLGVALPRQIAHSVGDVETRARQYFLSAFTVAVVFVTSLGLIAALNAERLARWCLGSNNRTLVYAMVLLLFGTATQTVVFGYFRGLERVQAANLVSFGASFVVPLLALGLTYNSHSASRLIGVIGLGLAVASLLWAMPKIAAARDFRHHFVRDARQLLRYGIGRVPGDIALGGLLSLGPMLASHYVNMAQDSYLLLGITCLTMAGLAFAPAGMVLLARISRLLGTGRHEDVKVYVGHLRSAVLQISLFLVVQGIVFTRPIVLWWLGPSCLPGVTVIQMVIVAVPAYMYFVALRSVVDAASNVAHNAHNVLIAVAVLVALLAAIIHFVPREWVVMAVAAANTVAIFSLALATHRTLRVLKLADRPFQFGPLWVAALLGATSLAAQWVFHFQITKPAFCVVLLANLGLGFVLLRRSQPEWMGFVLRVAFTRT
jgi:O-antigen/teichoic acid export membrane protein